MLRLNILFYSLLLFCCTIYSCTQEDQSVDKIVYNTAYDTYLKAFTQGEVSKGSTIIVELSNKYQLRNKDSKELLLFSPEIEGELSWIGNQTLVFKPKKSLVSGTIYTASLNLDKLIGEGVPKELSEFKFQFKAKDQFINVKPMPSKIVASNNQKWYRIEGEVETYDQESVQEIESLLEIHNEDKEKLAIQWVHESTKKHRYYIDSIEQGSQPQALLVTWDGAKIGSKDRGNLSLEIPTVNEFKYNRSYRFNRPDQYLILEFSDLLNPTQNLVGLVTIGGKSVDAVIEQNTIKVFLNQKLEGKYKVQLSKNIQNLMGKNLDRPSTEDITFSSEKPAVRFAGKGNIIPNSSKMPLVFETVNLNAVDVRIIKIKEANVQQFFQVNRMDGNRELKRVGTVVLEKKIPLDKTSGLNLAEWTAHSIDLAGLIQPEPGAIYEVALGFRYSYSLYSCMSKDSKEAHVEEHNMLDLGKKWDQPNYSYSYWNYYGEEGYEYGDLKDPCSHFYYQNNKSVRKNILASDLGIIAKQGDNANLFVVNDLETTKPLEGVLIEFYDYHQELMTTVETDFKGMAKADFKGKTPFMLIAKKGKQRGYLRIDDGSALSMSRFDVAGSNYVKGLKGFIYGERGVWRPGDEVFLNFILEDKNKTLPKDHPVHFELRNPKGRLVLKKMNNASVGGIYNFNFATAEDAPTGTYKAIVKVGGATFKRSLKIETVKPNRLKMQMDLGKKSFAKADTELEAAFQTNWLHGAAGRNLRAKIDLQLKKTKTSFSAFPTYEFNDPANSFYPREKVLFDGKVDEDGFAKIPVKIDKIDYAPGTLKAKFNMQVFEPGGDFSIGQTSATYYPFDHYVGLRLPKGDNARNMLLTDKKHRVEIVTVDKEGKAKTRQNVEVTVYKLSWKWWFDANRESASSYRGKVNAKKIQEAVITTDASGKAFWDLEIKYPDWGRYLVRVKDAEGHCSGKVVYVDWPGWAGRSMENDPEGATALRFSTDKAKYNVGETITVNIPTGFAGRALVTIENSSKILKAEWVEANKGTVQYTFEATAAMTPNAYIHVSLLQPHAQTTNDLPIRMYGVTPLYVEDPNTHLEPEITMADELRPLQDFEVEVSERRGGPMSYTIAIVDDGLLDLTAYKTPNPWNVFYTRSALGIKTWDMYNNVLGAFGGKVKSLLSIGGDEALNGKARKKPNRFKPVVMYLGPFTLDKGERRKHQFKMPNYVGSVRAMVVATEKGAYGSTEKTVKVRQPLMVLGTLPRVLGPGEELQLPVSVFAMKEGIKSAEVKIGVEGKLSIEGPSKKTVNFTKVGDELCYFNLKTAQSIGEAKVRIEVKSGNHQAVHEIDITLRNANPRETKVWPASLAGQSNTVLTYTPVGMLGTNKANLELSAVPALNLGKRLRYLIRYPYGCVEQTTSSVFPQLYLSDLLDLNTIQKQDLERNIKSGISRLYHFQTSDGGLSYWPGNMESSEWGSNYAGHFLLEAKDRGYKVRQDFLDKWLVFQNQKAQNWVAKNNYADDLTQAYRLYLLALAKKPNLGAMNRMRLKKFDRGAVVSRWYLALAYSLIGQNKVAEELTAAATIANFVSSSNMNHRTFGSTYRDKALILQALSLMNKNQEANKLLSEICGRLSENSWLSTQETAQALIAVAKYIGVQKTGDKMNFEYRLSSQDTWKKVVSNKMLWSLDLDAEQYAKLEIKNKGNRMLFVRLIGDGVPMNGAETSINKGLDLNVRYYDQAQVIGKDKNQQNIYAEITPSKLEQGKDLFVEVKITNTSNKNLYELALHHIFPSGWEIHNTRLLGRKNMGDKAEYQDFRDDRVYTFFDLRKGATKTFKFMINSSYLGKYYLPAIAVEAMYDHSIQARKAGEWIEVVQRKAN